MNKKPKEPKNAQEMEGKKYQFVWYWLPKFHYRKFDIRKTCWAYIYDWTLKIGFLEIRKWSTKKIKK